jgi:hypothetical protein
MAIPTSETTFQFAGTFYKLSKVPYSGVATDFKVDQSAVSAVLLEPASGGPTVTLGAADSSFEKTVNIAAGGTNEGGTVTVISAHTGSTLSSSKP